MLLFLQPKSKYYAELDIENGRIGLALAKPRPQPTTTASPVTNPAIVPVHKQTPGQIALLTVLAFACIVILLIGSVIVCRGIVFKSITCEGSLREDAVKIIDQLKGFIKRELLVIEIITTRRDSRGSCQSSDSM